MKNSSRLFYLLFLAAVGVTYFQPAFRIQISGVTGSQWSAHQLGQSFYQFVRSAVYPQKKPLVKVKVEFGFFDYLKKLFPKKNKGFHFKASMGLALAVFIPITFLLSYAGVLLGALIAMLPGSGKKTKFFWRSAFVLSVYALAGILILQEKSGSLAREALDQASQGYFGFVAKSFVRQMSIEPAAALWSLPVLTALLWFQAEFKKRSSGR